jgi:hypothetical protein
LIDLLIKKPGAVSNAKIKAFEAAFFLFFCFSKEKIPHRDKKEHD